jgi:hypothetical protein
MSSYKTLDIHSSSTLALPALMATLTHLGMQSLHLARADDGDYHRVTTVVKCAGDIAESCVELMQTLPAIRNIEISSRSFL